jgi:protein-disulfide isomerase
MNESVPSMPILARTLLVAGAVLWPALCPAAKDSTAFPQATAAVPIADGDPQLGRREAPLTLVVFVDYQDPFSRKLMTVGIAQLRARYGNDLRVVLKDSPLPFHGDAVALASAAHGVYAQAGARAFEKFVALVSEHQGGFDQETLVGLALVAGVRDRKAFEQQLLLQTWLRQVQESQRVVKSLGLSGTPVSFFNGLKMTGAWIGSELEARYPPIDAELEASKAELRRGFKPIDLYGYRVKQNIDHDLVGGREPAGARPGSAPVLEPEVGIGVVRLGMSAAQLRALPNVRLTMSSADEACVNTSSRGDACTYSAHLERGAVSQIRYNIAARGLVFDGVTLPADATLERTLRVLRCGALEIGEGGGSANCPRHVRVDQPSGLPQPPVVVVVTR